MMECFRRILIVDNNPVVLDSLYFVLDMAGYSVRCCNHIEAALDLLSCFRFDLMIAKLETPEENSRHMVRIVREKYPETKVIFYTSLDIDLDKIVLLGAYDVLQKPLEGRVLVDRVEKCLEDRRATKRFEIGLSAYLAGVDVETVNICSNGFLLATKADFKGLIGRQVDFSIPGLRPPLVTSAKVIRNGPGEGQTAISFTKEMGQPLVCCLKNRI